ncbi:thiamine phosphate synthase [Rhizobiales bacterium]|uniref:thiamine phosphate synthase n=1 Tax=Hongsoonwoonella zoysiae TaxID=2821844 RepID=UPI00155F5FB8|nr:thiamine phosphate synthase [Hongsoonwoonella zoysiae]NRG16483.1 thiamine phosphate synthase [Hongsoonwoonella zoysiae]
MPKPVIDFSLYLVIGPRDCGGRNPADVAQAAASGGVTLVQLRDKEGATRDILTLAREMKTRLDPLGVPLIVNDRIDVALAAEAAGAHLGQDDMPLEEARRLAGPEFVIGVSIGSEAERDATPLGLADHAGVGACFPSSTKADADSLGVEGLRTLRPSLPLPVVGIGGITAENAAEVIAAGADGVAVVSAICGAPDPAAAARALSKIINKS